MKNVFLIATVTIAMGGLSTVDAAPFFGKENSRAPQHMTSQRGPSHHASPSARGKRHKVRTVEVKRNRVPKHSFDRRSRRVNTYVTVITYRDIYSDGTSRIWTKQI